MTATRTDPERHKEQVRKANRARHRAVRRLIAENRSRFDVLYAEEAAEEGVEPKPRAAADQQSRMEAQIAYLSAQVSKLTKKKAPAKKTAAKKTTKKPPAKKTAAKRPVAKAS